MVVDNKPGIQIELAKLSDIEVLENEQMWACRVIDECSTEESGSIVVAEFTHQNDTAES